MMIPHESGGACPCHQLADLVDVMTFYYYSLQSIYSQVRSNVHVHTNTRWKIEQNYSLCTYIRIFERHLDNTPVSIYGFSFMWYRSSHQLRMAHQISGPFLHPITGRYSVLQT